MSYQIGFGLGESPTQWYLPGTNTAVLPELPVDGAAPVAGAIRETIAGDVTNRLAFGDAVAITSGTRHSHPDLVFDVTGAWNSVKNAAFVSDGAASVRFSGFVHVDVMTVGGGPSIVEIEGAKRGNIWTDAGDDVVSIEALTNGRHWSNEFRVATGQGADIVHVSAFDAKAAAAGDATYAATTGGAGTFAPDNAGTRTFVDLGQGADLFRSVGLSRDEVDGGQGADTIEAGGGDDTLTGGKSNDLFRFAAGDGHDSILDFRPGSRSDGDHDLLLFKGMGRAELQAMLDAAVEDGANTVLTYGDGDTIHLFGAAKAELSMADFAL